MLRNYLQQTTSADDIFGYIFLGALRVKQTHKRVVVSHKHVGAANESDESAHICSLARSFNA